MRNNQPVTSTEYTLGDHVTLMSKTDPKGRITYANQPFVDVSGFSQAELVDQPHNLVRHPDMPAQAFADMWATLKSGRSWSALVKNRRKNGDFYWVRANATPIRHGGVTKGYMSVRSKPLPAEVAGAEQLYKQFRDGTAGARAFRQGIVVRTGLLAWIDLFKVLSVAWRVRGAFAVAALLPIAAAAAAGIGGVPLAIVAATAVLTALLSDLAVEQQVTRPLTTILEQAQCVASGASHPAVNLDRIDEIGLLTRSITQISLSQQALVHDVNARASSVRDGSAEIAQGNQDLSQRTEQQAAALEETAASMEQLSATVRQNADNASHANTLTQNSSSIAARGGDMMNKVTETMRDIDASSKRIADIVGVIDSIAFQTNILALNAAVEAARAGEQGRGFAVVASEVRSLAGRSAEAAREIKTLIAASVARVAEGNTLVDQAGATMTEVVDSVKRVTEIMAEISAASAEQSAGVSQVGEAVSQMDQVTQQNAALVEQSAAAAESLREQSLALVQVVSAFLAEGDRADATHGRPMAKAVRPDERRAATAVRAAVPRAAARPRSASAAGHADTAGEWLAA